MRKKLPASGVLHISRAARSFIFDEELKPRKEIRNIIQDRCDGGSGGALPMLWAFYKVEKVDLKHGWALRKDLDSNKK